MAYFPVCDFESHPWLKKKHLVYIGFGSGGDFQRYRLRFCPKHLAILQEDLADFEVMALEAAISGGYGSVVKCVACGKPVREGGRQLFVTCYPTQDERKDYWSPVHEECSIPGYLTEP